MLRHLRQPSVVLLCAAVLAGCLAWFWPISGAITPANCDAIKPGMTRSEVYELLGGPGWEPQAYTLRRGEYIEIWHGLVWNAWVLFDDWGRVIRVNHGSRF